MTGGLPQGQMWWTEREAAEAEKFKPKKGRTESRA